MKKFWFRFSLEYSTPPDSTTLDGKKKVVVPGAIELWANTQDDAVTIFSTLFRSNLPFPNNALFHVATTTVEEMPS